MTDQPVEPLLGKPQRVVLLLMAVALAAALLVLRGGVDSRSPMEQLARRSLDPDQALQNGRPTIVEFYADWCQACREMAPAMLSLEQSTGNKLDIVLVNVDNPRWGDLVDEYDVNGIPQLNFFAADGQPRGRSIGVRQPDELNALGNALITGTPLPQLAGVGMISAVNEANTPRDVMAGPRSHG
tara:strand:- start:8094 stop:8645 length:552 start_codon:yes stop_codon:yes gene_type:complete